MKFGQLKEVLNGGNIILKVSDRIVEDIAFRLGYEADFYARGYDVDDWMESTFDYAIGDYIDLAANSYDMTSLDRLGIDGYSYFDNREVNKVATEYIDDFGGECLVITLV